MTLNLNLDCATGPCSLRPVDADKTVWSGMDAKQRSWMHFSTMYFLSQSDQSLMCVIIICIAEYKEFCAHARIRKLYACLFPKFYMFAVWELTRLICMISWRGLLSVEPCVFCSGRFKKYLQYSRCTPRNYRIMTYNTLLIKTYYMWMIRKFDDSKCKNLHCSL